MECTLCLGYIIVLSSHCLVCGYLCVEGPPPLGRLLYELVLRSALVQVSAAARARLLYVLRPAQPRAVSYSAGRERARQQARSGGRCYQRRSPTATRNVIEPGPKELVVVSMCCADGAPRRKENGRPTKKGDTSRIEKGGSKASQDMN